LVRAFTFNGDEERFMAQARRGAAIVVFSDVTPPSRPLKILY